MKIMLIQGDARDTSRMIDRLRDAGYDIEQVSNGWSTPSGNPADLALWRVRSAKARLHGLATPRECAVTVGGRRSDPAADRARYSRSRSGRAAMPLGHEAAAAVRRHEFTRRLGALDQPLTETNQLFALVQRFINDCLGSRELTPERIAAAHYMSLRSLQRLFQMHGFSVAGWIRKQRLERCRRDLADPMWAAQPVSGIARRWGFPDAAHFSRTFKQTYGVSPSKFRQDASCPTTPPVRPDRCRA